MPVPLFLLICAAAFALLYLIVKRAKEYGETVVHPTVEAEQDVIAHIPQHTGSAATTVGEHDYTYDDLDDSTPESITEYIAKRKRRAY